jgi:hypothetical protein
MPLASNLQVSFQVFKVQQVIIHQQDTSLLQQGVQGQRNTYQAEAG